MSSENNNQHPKPKPAISGHKKYASFQNEIYAAGTLHGGLSLVTTDSNKLEEQARSKLSLNSYNYVAGGAGERATMDSNRLAFRQWKIVPRMLRPTTNRDLAINLFGHKYESPVLMAPIGVQSIFHHHKEVGLAEVCAELNVPYILSTAATSSIEDVATANGDGPRWFQLYWPHDDDVTKSLLKRAKENGYSVLVVTLDTWSLAWRPADLDQGYIPFARGIGNQIGFTDPVYREKFEKRHGAKIEDKLDEASLEWIGTVCPGVAHTWDALSLLRKIWDGPIVLKGIQHPEDAILALEAGCQGIIVSNHGGRQLDGAVASLEMLPGIAEAVGDKMTVLFDSGIRTGVDIIKALSLGAKAVLVGRPVIYGLAIGGKNGAKSVLRGLLADFDQSMGLAGIQSIKDCNMSMLRKVKYGGDLKSSL